MFDNIEPRYRGTSIRTRTYDREQGYRVLYRETHVLGSLPQAHAFEYALPDAILTTLARTGGDPRWDVLIVAAFVGLGTAYCYEANGGSEGTDFIARCVSLGWVVGWRVILASILPAILVAVIATARNPSTNRSIAPFRPEAEPSHRRSEPSVIIFKRNINSHVVGRVHGSGRLSGHIGS